MSDRQNFVAVGLLTQRDLDMLGSGFQNVYPITEDCAFAELIEAIDRRTAGRRPSGGAQPH